LLAVAAGASLAACGGATPVWIPSIAGGPPNVQRPAEIALTRAGRIVLIGLTWSQWGGATATASGELRLAVKCVPNCALGAHKVDTARVQATEITTCQGRRAYARVKTFIGTTTLTVPMCRQPAKPNSSG